MPIDLSVFCDPTTGATTRYDLATPWVFDGWRYATEGKILVREPAPGEPSAGDIRAFGSNEGKRPRAHEFFDTFPPDGFIQDWPAVEYGEEPCEACGGKEKCRCSRCGAQHECQECNGRGRELKDTMIAGRLFAGWAVARIGLLDRVKFRTAGRPDEALAFIADGGRQGLVMPIVPHVPGQRRTIGGTDPE